MRAGKEGRSRYGLWKFCSHLFFFCNLVSDILELCALKNVEITDYFYSFFLPSPEVNRKWLWFCGLLSLHALWYLHLHSHCMKLPDFWRCQSLPTNRPHGPSGCAQMPPTALGSDTSIPHRGEPDLCAHSASHPWGLHLKHRHQSISSVPPSSGRWFPSMKIQLLLPFISLDNTATCQGSFPAPGWALPLLVALLAFHQYLF